MRSLFLDINNALEVTFMEFLICNQLLIDFLAAGVRKIVLVLIVQDLLQFAGMLQKDCILKLLLKLHHL